MPVVFIHGVNVREGTKLDKETKQRNENLARIFFPLLGRQITTEKILNPYWGDLATRLSPGNPFIPVKKLLVTRLVERLHAGNGSLIELARRRPMSEVFDVMVAASFEHEESDDDAKSISSLGYFLLRLNGRFKNFEEQLDWLSNVNSDAEFVAKIESEFEKSGAAQADKRSLRHLRNSATWLKQSYGKAREHTRSNLSKVRDRLRTDITRARQRTRSNLKAVAQATRTATTHMTASALTQPMRKLFHERMFLFIGDAFLYFGQRGTPERPGPIVQRMLDALTTAQALVTEDDPEVIVIAHSMGGNIICDVVSHFDTQRPIDLLITVGSQFPLFADLEMFPGLGTGRPFTRPSSVKRWINIYDTNDVFGFAAQPLFEGIEDKHYASGRFGVATHADCFKFISLYEHMAQAVLSKA